MNNQKLFSEIKRVVELIDKSDSTDLHNVVIDLKSLGITSNIHLGQGDKMDNSEEGLRLKLEWIGGQLLDIIGEKGWHVMNSAINFAYSALKDIEKELNK